MKTVAIVGFMVFALFIGFEMAEIAYRTLDVQTDRNIEHAAMSYSLDRNGQYPPDGIIRVSDAAEAAHGGRPQYAAGETPSPWDTYLPSTPTCSLFGRGHYVFHSVGRGFRAMCDADPSVYAGDAVQP